MAGDNTILGDSAPQVSYYPQGKKKKDLLPGYNAGKVKANLDTSPSKPATSMTAGDLAASLKSKKKKSNYIQNMLDMQ